MKRCLLVVAIVVITACKPKETEPAADPNHGKQLIGQYGCTTCHVIPGIDGTGMIGPSLEHVAVRPTLAQKLPNTPKTMSNYIQNPQAVNAQNEMPNLGVKPDEARDIAAYLYTLK
jgi:cytochrome c2